ncbi:response regulator [Candidatus Nitrospira bockiana]
METAMRENSRGGGTVMVVDDHEVIRDMTRENLESHGFRVITASDGVDAVIRYAQHGGRVDLVLTDMMMPRMNGAETIRALRALNPDIKIIAMSAMLESLPVARAAYGGQVPWLKKPYSMEELLTTVSAVLKEEIATRA